MKIVVYQSFRTTNVPHWITRCLNSVKDWTKNQGFDYQFFDDSMFSYAPDWYRKKVNNQIHLVSDLARLEIAQSLLNQNYHQAIWVDADVLIFDPESFQLPHNKPFSFCREAYIDKTKSGRLESRIGVNNAITLMTAGNSFLPFYIDACKAIVKHTPSFSRIAVGTKFLSITNQQFPIDHIRNLGLFSPYVMHDLAVGKGPALELFAREFKYPIYAANLCLTFNGRKLGKFDMSESLFEKIIGLLLDSRGRFINQLIESKLHRKSL